MLTLEVDREEIAERMKTWSAPTPLFSRGVFAKYAARVSSASLGAILQ
jgi:dihydroxy-acid dehydratase